MYTKYSYLRMQYMTPSDQHWLFVMYALQFCYPWAKLLGYRWLSNDCFLGCLFVDLTSVRPILDQCCNTLWQLIMVGWLGQFLSDH